MQKTAIQTNATLTWQLTPTIRKAVMVLHAICGIGWMGVDIALFILLMTVRTTDDAAYGERRRRAGQSWIAARSIDVPSDRLLPHAGRRRSSLDLQALALHALEP
jgi:hypothetical protein